MGKCICLWSGQQAGAEVTSLAGEASEAAAEVEREAGAATETAAGEAEEATGEDDGEENGQCRGDDGSSAGLRGQLT